MNRLEELTKAKEELDKYISAMIILGLNTSPLGSIRTTLVQVIRDLKAEKIVSKM